MNTQTVQHTPTPWSLGDGNSREIWGYQGDENQNDVLVASCQSNGLIRTDENRANAAFIVKAVNCHEELVTRLKQLLVFCETYKGMSRHDLKHEWEAIAKAEGK